MRYIDQEPGDRLRASIEHVYTDACIRFMNARRDERPDGGERYFALTNAIQGAFPAVVAALQPKSEASE